MENVVPGELQRLRASDIIRMAGLKAASLGQEYYRLGAVHDTQRQGTTVAGVVTIPNSNHTSSFVPSLQSVSTEQTSGVGTNRNSYPVEVEIRNTMEWMCNCLCHQNEPLLCPHAAALLYQWLARPMTFTARHSSLSVSPSFLQEREAMEHVQLVQVHEGHGAHAYAAQAKGSESTEGMRESTREKLVHTMRTAKSIPRGPVPLSNLNDILNQVGLSELRAIAREYDIVTNGMSKQQLVETILDMLKQPEIVRRVASTLEKPQRQLLAALTLAGGSMMDDDLRGLFERFNLGQQNQLQGVLMALQGKALLFRTSMNSSPQQQIGLQGALLDIGWYVPPEVRTALRVTVPVTHFEVHESTDKEGKAPVIQQASPDTLLADLLLVVRTLDGYRLFTEVLKEERNLNTRPLGASSSVRPASLSGALTNDGSMAIPPPSDVSPASLLTFLQRHVPILPARLRFAFRLLRLADILHKDDSGAPYLQALPNAPQLLLGPTRREVLRDLFELWLRHASYEELFDLQDDGLRLRCRATSLNHPILRSGELEAENSEARQALLALLAQAPTHQWMNFNSFARFVYRLQPLFLQKRQRLFSSPHWWMEQEAGRPLRPLELSDWLRGEMHYLTRLIRGPLYWWGLCDLALDQDDRLLAFRLTSTANWLWSDVLIEEEMEEEVIASQIALPQALEIVDTGTTSEILVASSVQLWPVIQVLESFTQPAGVRQGRLYYRFTPRAISEALSQGRSPNALLELLYRLKKSDTQKYALLASLIERLEQWVNSYGHIRIYTGVNLLEAADTGVMRELSATTSLDGQIIQSIQPTLHILKKTGAEQIIEELKRRGQNPLLHDEDFYGKK